MSTTLVPVDLRPAEGAREEDLPTLPAWWPLEPTGEHRSPEARAAHRHAAALAEARQGPYDGQQGEVVVRAGGAPPPSLTFAHGAVVYRLDLRASKGGRAVYRYDPAASPAHRGLMAAVAEAYGDRGASYADEARQGDRQNRPGPEAV